MNSFKIIFLNITLSGLLLLFLGITVHAQPSPSDLADQIEEAHTRYLSNIETLTITYESEMIGSQTVRYTKQMEDGLPVLKPDNGDDEDPFSISGNNSKEMRAFVTGASSITNDTYNGKSVYRIFVDDPQVFEDMQFDPEFDDEFDDDNWETSKATAWIGRDDFLIYRMEFDVNESGNTMKVIMKMDDYQTFEGMPVPMLTEMEIEGLENMMSDEEYEEARQAMEELERELENLPEAQREMIKEQMAPQIERFEQMMAGEGAGAMKTRVTDVRVNE